MRRKARQVGFMAIPVALFAFNAIGCKVRGGSRIAL
jgi:hypothetical protein